MINPAYYLFDHSELEREREVVVKYSLPYSEIRDRSEAEIADAISDREPLELSHTLEDQIGVQLKAGFLMADFCEDKWDGPLETYMATSMATLWIKGGAS